MLYVRQKHRYGCGPACLITGEDYDQVTRTLGGDFESNHGITFHDMDDYLVERGYAISRMWRYKRGNIPREPWPPQPWADIHLCMAEINKAIGGTHFILWLKDGSVLDPNCEGVRSFRDYDICQVAGIHKVL